MTEQAVPGATPKQPVYFKLVVDDAGEIRWGRVLIMLGLSLASAYLSVRVQRTASSPDLGRTVAMSVAKRRITAGRRLQAAGKAVEDAGWAAYESARG